MAPTRPLTAPLTILAVVLAVGLATSPWAWAQDARVLAAQKEGKVVWYTSLALPSSEKVAKLFEAAYPGVVVEVHRTGSQRVMQELAANIFSLAVQQALVDTEGLYTGHPGVKYPTGRPKLGDLKLLHVDPEELKKRNEEIKTRFEELFGA
jgi:hypothetical protein